MSCEITKIFIITYVVEVKWKLNFTVIMSRASYFFNGLYCYRIINFLKQVYACLRQTHENVNTV